MDIVELALIKIMTRPVTIQSIIEKSNCKAYVNNGEAKTESCFFCQEMLELDETIIKFPCGHEFHYDCLYQWIQIKRYVIKCQECGEILELN